MNPEQICRNTLDLVHQVGSYIKSERLQLKGENVQSKGLHNFVTYVDKTAETKLINGLKLILPQSGFYAEEETSNYRAPRFNWIIDPLDGTTNYIHGLPPHAISIALQDGTETIIGIVYEIVLEECFFAWENSKAYLNNDEIHVSDAKTVSESLIATGFPYYDYSKLPQFMDSLSYFMQNSHGLRRIGSAATDLAYVACGRFDAFYEYSLNAWDVAAGAFIVQQAGGKVCDFRGENNYLYGREIIATNGFIHRKFVDVIEKIMNK